MIIQTSAQLSWFISAEHLDINNNFLFLRKATNLFSWMYLHFFGFLFPLSFAYYLFIYLVTRLIVQHSHNTQLQNIWIHEEKVLQAPINMSKNASMLQVCNHCKCIILHSFIKLHTHLTSEFNLFTNSEILDFTMLWVTYCILVPCLWVLYLNQMSNQTSVLQWYMIKALWM